MPPLSWADLVIVGVIGLSGLIGMIRGLIREVFSLASWGVAVWLALKFSPQVAAHLESVIAMPSARLAAAFGIVFFAVLLVLGLVGLLLETLVEKTGLSGTDRVAGLLFGIARGVLVVAVLVLLAGFTPLPADPWWKQSRLIPAFQSLSLWLRDQIPPHFTDRFKPPIDPRKVGT
jgi:membrane protein required for colicin V production